MADTKRFPGDTLQAIEDLQYDPDAALRRIAALLRAGEATQSFLSSLADLMDPDLRPRDWEPNVKLVVKRGRRGQPPSKPNTALGLFLHQRIDYGETNYDAAVTEACERYGADREECRKALKRVREIHEPLPVRSDEEE
ncbi:hypothetical protein [Qingshengfaniella alkalisoli]|uniref:Uncharacterized protein n=1 Tax=Qingshengfaniella alkalisoli TaxID=2599296 RepID=A0A5B8IWB3_9RHOB|nr:hypothetical protein [Qingshengfaniella alkalisoli]QDY69803.1 hypothetical protein FPZ52_09335 [Qingshengfaniella alkalisoli]